MIFHECSEKMHSWMSMQPHVKEESLTDWLLYHLSHISARVKYFAFNRHEEAANGADWEWWILTDDHGFKFRVQAKKLRPGRDNWPLISYGNQKGAQIDLLLEASRRSHAFPLYAFYSTGRPKIAEQKRAYTHGVLHKLLEWCQTCQNGCFIAPAHMVYDGVFLGPKRPISDQWLVSQSLPMSVFDYPFEHSDDDARMSALADDWLSILNSRYTSLGERKDDRRSAYHNPHGFRYSYGKGRDHAIPDYLRYAMAQNQDTMRYMTEFQAHLADVDGICLVDLRSAPAREG